MSASILYGIELPEGTAAASCRKCKVDLTSSHNVWACLQTETWRANDSFGQDREENEYGLQEGDVAVDMNWMDEMLICNECMSQFLEPTKEQR